MTRDSVSGDALSLDVTVAVDESVGWLIAQAQRIGLTVCTLVVRDAAGNFRRYVVNQ